MNRRNFVQHLAAMGAFFASQPLLANALRKSKKLLLVSGWQDVNIGDITHTPGLLHVLETFIPGLEITLWKKGKGEEVHALLSQNFPRVKIIYGDVDKSFQVDSPDVLDAFKTCDFMMHGSGPGIVGQPHLEAWVKATGKPIGIFGTTIQYINPELKTLLDKAKFIYTRETASIKILAEHGLKGDHIAFAPDGTFFLNLHNDAKASEFLKANALEQGKYICAVPRLRYTPYYQWVKDWASEERIKFIDSENEKHKEPDHAKLREAMIRWVRDTGHKVLVCPEMTYQVQIMDDLLINPLPDDVKPNVIKRGYWLPDEAASVYKNAFAVLSFECHSPIIAAANNIPFFYLRQPEDTIKGQMYYDLGFNDWVFEIEQSTGSQIADRLMSIYQDLPNARKKLNASRENIREIYRNATSRVSKIV